MVTVKNLETELVDRNGKPIKDMSMAISDVRNLIINNEKINMLEQLDKAIEQIKPETYKSVYENSLLYKDPNNKNDTTDFYMDRYDIWEKIHNANGEVELDKKEIEKLKDCIVKARHGIIVVGQTMKNLDKAVAEEVLKK